MTTTPLTADEGLWRARHRAAPDTDTDLPDEVDVLVVGAGLTGLVTAVRLAASGRTPVVIDSHGPGFGASGRSTGKASLLQGLVLSHLLGRHGEAVAGDHVRSHRMAQGWIEAFGGRHDIGLEQRPALTWADDPSQVRALRREWNACRFLDLPVTWSERADVPGPVHGALELPGQWQLDPMAFVLALVDEVRALGGRVLSGVSVRDVEADPGPGVRLDDGRLVRADVLVLATGQPVTLRGAWFAREEARRSYLLALSGVTPPTAMALTARSPGISLRSVDAGNVTMLVGGGGHPTGRVTSEARQLDRLHAWVARHLPAATVEHVWSAQDHHLPSGVPWAGALPGAEGRILAATGYQKWGVTGAVAAAAKLERLTLDGRSGTSRPGGVRENLRTVSGLVRLNTAVVGQAVRGLVGAGTTRRCPVRCTHLGGVLHWNDVEQSWDCPLHGSRFAPDGTVLDGPATAPLSATDLTA